MRIASSLGVLEVMSGKIGILYKDFFLKRISLCDPNHYVNTSVSDKYCSVIIPHTDRTAYHYKTVEIDLINSLATRSTTLNTTKIGQNSGDMTMITVLLH